MALLSMSDLLFGDDGKLIYQPAMTEIAALLHARTVDANGNEIGVFNEDTRPNAVQVDTLAALATGEVVARIGYRVLDNADPLFSVAQSVSAIRAAMLIELSYFPEQISSEQSPYIQLKDLYDSQIAFLIGALEGNTAGLARYASIRVKSPTMSSLEDYYQGAVPVDAWLAP